MQNSKCLISCIVAIYNVEKYLDECISSLINQKYYNVEIILVDDGSTDKSNAICQKYAEQDKRIKLISQKNEGANSARNRGLEEATGEWIYLCDGDDYVCDDIFSSIEDKFLDDVDVVMFSAINVKGEQKSPYQSCIDEAVIEGDDFKNLQLSTLDRFYPVKYNYKYFDGVSIWNKCYRKSFLKDNNITFVPKMPKLQDLTFNLLVYEKAKKAVFVNHHGYCYRYNETSVSNRYQPDFDKKAGFIIKWIYDYSEPYMADSDYYKAFCGRILSIVRTAAKIDFFNKNNDIPYRKCRESYLKFVSEIEEYINDADISYLPRDQKIHSFCLKKHLLWMYYIYTSKLK